MKYLISLIVTITGCLSLSAQTPTDSLQRMRSSAQIEVLQAEIANLKTELALHRSKEDYFSDILQINFGWFGIIVGLMGAVFGLISWANIPRRMNKIQRKAHDDLIAYQNTLRDEFTDIIREHKKQDNHFIGTVNRDRYKLRTIVSNLCMSEARNAFNKQKSDRGIFYSLTSLLSGTYDLKFYNSLDANTQKWMESIHNTHRTIVAARLRLLLKSIQNVALSNPKFLESKWNQFLNMTFPFDEGDEIKRLRSQIVSTLQPFFDLTEKEPNESDETI